MKILLITNPRTGSTYFGSSLSKTYNIPFINEPAFLDDFKSALSSDNGYVMKVVIPQLYWYYYAGIEPTLNLSKEESINEFYRIISEYKFDKIILLDRRNENEFIDSLINLLVKYADKPQLKYEKWVYDAEFKKINTTKKREYYKHYIDVCKDWMKSVSIKFNIPIIYYEDLYYNTNKVDLQGLHFVPDTTKKLRVNPTIL